MNLPSLLFYMRGTVVHAYRVFLLWEIDRPLETELARHLYVEDEIGKERKYTMRPSQSRLPVASPLVSCSVSLCIVYTQSHHI